MNHHLYKIFADGIRCLSIDMVNEANSGHQGAALGFADVTAVLLKKSMKFSPRNPQRDRLILSAGHASAMLYSSLYLLGNPDITMDNLRSFRKFGSLCQGHPELNRALGIEMTTGALGQGIATSVGFAIALKKKKGDSKVFVIVGDGDLMEGVSHEAMTLAGALNLDNLIVLFDNNNVCIDGKPSDVTTDNISRFKAYGFDVFEADGHDYGEIENTLERAKKSARPTFVSFKTIIGRYSKQEGTCVCHGKFLSDNEVLDIREKLNFPREHFELPFLVEQIPHKEYENNESNFDELDKELNSIKREFIEQKTTKSTRAFAGEVFSKLSQKFDYIIGTSADLSESTCSISVFSKSITKDDFSGNYVHSGIREHAMGCILNGLSIEGFVPHGGTFLAFSDYMRPAIRNAAIMNIGAIFVLTHDSIAVGEDGATHQPIEHLASLRAIPNLLVMRPSCDVEVAECIQIAIKNRNIPTALVLSRQNVSNLRKEHKHENLSKAGMYEILPYSRNNLEKLTIIASGSEVSLAFELAEFMADQFDVRVVSAPCFELFDNQDASYKNSILKDRKIIIEAGSKMPLYKYRTNQNDIIVGIDEFGTSGTQKALYEHFGFKKEKIAELVNPELPAENT